MKFLLALIFAVTSLAATANVLQLEGEVIEIIDGNTFVMKTAENDTYKVMLYGIDCPELGQKYGAEAKKCLQKLLMRKNITVQIQGRDRSGTHIAIVTTSDDLDPRIQLLEEGLAWTAEGISAPELESHRSSAQQKAKGLWKEKEPTPPWVYRKQQSTVEAKQS